LQREYRNKFYVVVRSRTTAGWNWAVDVDARTVRGGQAASEQGAIKAAERLIDGVLAPGRRRLRLVGAFAGWAGLKGTGRRHGATNGGLRLR
jgi:hypothetical protein